MVSLPRQDVTAPGGPGLEPRWTSSSKSGVGTAPGPLSRVWFATSHGIVNEVYYPHFDKANTRDMGLIVTDRQAFFSEEKRDTDSTIEMLAPGVPGFRMRNVCRSGRYAIDKTVLTDPAHDVLLQKIRFEALQGAPSDYSLFVLLAPHVQNFGAGNDGWAGDYKGVPMLLAQRDGVCLAFASSMPFLNRSCGYVGVSDGWHDLRANYRLTQIYPQALNGNIALTAELQLDANSECVLALGFGHSPDEAALQARAALLRGFDSSERAYVAGWQAVQSEFLPSGRHERR